MGPQAFAGALQSWSSTDPVERADPANWISGLALGSEVEVAFGNSLQVNFVKFTPHAQHLAFPSPSSCTKLW